MAITELTGVYEANDLYRATLRTTWISSPAATTLAVTAVPDNVPTIVTVGWNTDVETVFSVEGKSGDSSSNYTLTGVARLKGANTNIPENTAVNCLNHEEFFNQYEEKINEMVGEVNDALDDVDTALGQLDGTASGAILDKPIVKGVVDLGTVGATETVSWAAGDRQKMTLDENVTITFSNAAEGQTLTLYMLQDGTGTNTITFADTIVWADATTPSWTTTADKLNIAVITYVGSAYYGVGNKFA